jgi:cyclin-C
VLTKVAKELKPPLRQVVLATALVYFRRFYLKASFVDFDPRLVAPTCLWLASKVEECAIGKVSLLVQQLERVGNPFGSDDILVCEFLLLEELDYDLTVYHPYDLLDQFARDTAAFDHIDSLWVVVNDTYLTAAALRHAPQIVALGCIHVAALIRELDLSAWFGTLNVDHAAVWDVARRVLDLYELLNEISQPADRPTTLKLLSKLSPAYELRPDLALPAATSAASSVTARAAASLQRSQR